MNETVLMLAQFLFWATSELYAFSFFTVKAISTHAYMNKKETFESGLKASN